MVRSSRLLPAVAEATAFASLDGYTPGRESSKVEAGGALGPNWPARAHRRIDLWRGACHGLLATPRARYAGVPDGGPQRVCSPAGSLTLPPSLSLPSGASGTSTAQMRLDPSFRARAVARRPGDDGAGVAAFNFRFQEYCWRADLGHRWRMIRMAGLGDAAARRRDVAWLR